MYETAPEEHYYEDDDDGLGYYEDGVKRTLTDEQIAMFRHSEIQRVLLERRRRQEAGEPIHDPPAPVVRSSSQLSDQSMSISSGDEQSQVAPAERVQQKWTATSEKGQTRSARNRKKNRKNYRTNKKARLREQEEQEKRAGSRAEELGEESDEWDPWHQATGPDAQKQEYVELDY